MSGVLTYPSSERVLSASVGYSILQAGKQGFLTDATVAAATSADDLIASVNAAVVAPGAEAGAQRLNIANAIARGKALGDLSDSRVQGATTPVTLAELTFVTEDPSYSSGHLGVGIYG